MEYPPLGVDTWGLCDRCFQCGSRATIQKDPISVCCSECAEIVYAEDLNQAIWSWNKSQRKIKTKLEKRFHLRD